MRGNYRFRTTNYGFSFITHSSQTGTPTWTLPARSVARTQSGSERSRTALTVDGRRFASALDGGYLIAVQSSRDVGKAGSGGVLRGDSHTPTAGGMPAAVGLLVRGAVSASAVAFR